MTFGLSPQGFVLPRQSDIVAALQASFRQQFGATVNLSSETVFGQIIAILSEREALWWEGLEDCVLSNTPGGAEGVYVDNLLAFSGLERLAAQATVTDPTPSVQSDGKVLYGLVLYGTQGTIIPAGALIQTSTQPIYTFALDNQVTIGAGQNCVQRLFFSSTPTQGTYALALEAPSGATVTTDAIGIAAQPQNTLLTYSAVPTSGTFTLTLGTQVTTPLQAGAQALDVQNAIQALTGFAGVGVQGAASTGYTLTWPQGPIPEVIAVGSAAPTVVQATQALINALMDPNTSLQPFSDVVVTAPTSNQLLISFGLNAPAKNQPSSGNAAQGAVVVAQNSLFAGNTQTNIASSFSVLGAPAQAVAQATCNATGSNPAPAGTLTVIGSSQQGWTGVTNQLDALTGRDTETDTQAIARRANLLASKGNGPLASVVEQVQQVSGVTSAIGFANLTAAAQQLVAFSTQPTSGTFELAYGANSTSALNYNVATADLQAALAALPGLQSVLVQGSYAYGWAVDFNGSFGGQATQLMAVSQDTTGAQLTVAFGRPPKSIEIVVEGGDDQAVGQAILQSAPAGIATYGAPVLQTTGSCTANSAAATLTSVGNISVGEAIFMQGLRPNTTIAGISGNTVTLSVPALSSASNVPVTVNYSIFIKDAAGNVQQVSFSRPQSLLIYTTCTLITDTYLSPGVPNSGRNAAAKFDPASLATVQADLIAIGNAVGIGGTIVAKGYKGLVGSFNDVPGILGFELAFDTVNPPKNQANLQMLPEQTPLFSTFSTTVSFQ